MVLELRPERVCRSEPTRACVGLELVGDPTTIKRRRRDACWKTALLPGVEWHTAVESLALRAVESLARQGSMAGDMRSEASSPSLTDPKSGRQVHAGEPLHRSLSSWGPMGP